jgi:eukaryotic-like serine/threonine-protein kinase
MSEPRVVGRYVVHAEIAAGGMATVHVGRLLGPVGFSRTVAIKRLHPHFAKDPEFVAMFLDEARLAARIRHPNVVPVLDVVAEGSELFLVMDYIEGESFSRLIANASRSGVVPPHRIAASIVAQMLHGLHAAHEARDERGEPLGIVHRDVSPQNVMVGTDGTARVLDFGVAKAIGRTSITREGELKGKLPYMAPEQIRRGGQVTRRTDVYAAGVVLWESLTAARLFYGDGEGEIFSAVSEGAKDPPSSVEPTIPRELDEITMRALSKDPSARYASARDMALEIERVIGHVADAEIAAWALELGRETIEQRQRAVAEIESSPGIVTANATPLLEETATLPAIQIPDLPIDDDETVQNLPIVDQTRTVPWVGKRPTTKKRYLLLPIPLLIIVPILILALRSKPEAPPTTTAPVKSAEPTPSVSESVEVEPVPTPVIELSAPPASAPVPSHPSIKKPIVVKPVTKPGCVPPYYYENGIKRFKPNCL